jgi:hypothetical protein
VSHVYKKIQLVGSSETGVDDAVRRIASDREGGVVFKCSSREPHVGALMRESRDGHGVDRPRAVQ